MNIQFGCDPHLPTDEPSSSFVFNKSQDYYEQLKKNLLTIQRQARDNINNQHNDIRLVMINNVQIYIMKLMLWY
jgi:argonaute-like protein implicated in RNA metabolism and viral defense